MLCHYPTDLYISQTRPSYGAQVLIDLRMRRTLKALKVSNICCISSDVCVLAVNMMTSLNQSVTYRYREFFIFLVVSEPVLGKIGTGKKSRNRYRKNWYRKKVSEPVSEKFGAGADFCRQNVCIYNIYN